MGYFINHFPLEKVLSYATNTMVDWRYYRPLELICKTCIIKKITHALYSKHESIINYKSYDLKFDSKETNKITFDKTAIKCYDT